MSFSSNNPFAEETAPTPLRDTEILRKAYAIAKREKDASDNRGKKAKSYKTMVKVLRSVLPEKSVTDKIDKIKQEIISTEESYTESLDVLVNVFVVPCKKYLNELLQRSNAAQDDSSTPFSATVPPPAVVSKLLDEHNKIFGNVELILSFNEQFLNMLRDDKTSIAWVFQKNSAFFKMYTDYVRNFSSALEQAKAWKETVYMGPFLRACELQPDCDGLDLNSYLIMPVQRIPRYKMLLAECMKCTPEKKGNMPNSDYLDLQEALDIVSGVATKLNNDMKIFEKRKQVVEIAEQFDRMELLIPSRYFVTSGQLKKVCKGGKKEFTFVLFNDCIVYGAPKVGTKRAPNGERIHNLHREINLYNTFIVSGVQNFMQGFILISHQKSFYVDCGSAVEANKWIAHFRSLYEELDDPKKISKKSSWREGDALDKEIKIWALGDDSEREDGDSEFWKLNALATDAGHGVIEVVDPSQVEGIGASAATTAGIALVRVELSGDGTSQRRSSTSSKMASGLRRMSQNFGKSFRTSKSNSEPPDLQSAPSLIMSASSATAISRQSEASSTDIYGSAPSVRVNSSGHFRPSPVKSTPATPPQKPTRRDSASKRKNLFLNDDLILYSAEFRARMGAYGLGLILEDVRNSYPDHPSESIVKVGSFPSLPNSSVSEAAKAGVKVGDYLVMVNGTGIDKSYQVPQVLEGATINDEVVLRIRRGGFSGGGAAQARKASASSRYSPVQSMPSAHSPTGDLLGLGGDGSGTLRPPSMSPPPPAPASAAVSRPTVAAVPSANSYAAPKASHRPAHNNTQRFSLTHGATVAAPPVPPQKPMKRQDNWTKPSQPIKRQDDWMQQQQQRSSEHRMSEGERRLSAKFGVPENFDPLNMKEIDFLNMFGVTKHKYRMMKEEDKQRLLREKGLGP